MTKWLRNRDKQEPSFQLLMLNNIFYSLLTFIFFFSCPLRAQETDDKRWKFINQEETLARMNEAFELHTQYKSLSPELTKRMSLRFIEHLDPNKIYFIKSEVLEWIEPSEEKIQKLRDELSEGNFSSVEELVETFRKAIKRRQGLENSITASTELPKIERSKLKELDWADHETALFERLKLLRALQLDVIKEMEPEEASAITRWLDKKRTEKEEEYLSSEKEQRAHHTHVTVLKSLFSSLDAHSVYFTPVEAQTYLRQMQRKITGIGVVMREEIEGYRILSLTEGSPAIKSKKIKPNDRIIAVNGKPIVGLDIAKGSLLIQGDRATAVTLTLQRVSEEDPENLLTFDVELQRDDIIFSEARYDLRLEPYGDGVILTFHMYSFYQDREDKVSSDLKNEIEKVAKEHSIKGVILDLRHNLGGPILQAVEISGLFINPGIVVSAKDHEGSIQHLRTLSTPIYDGPMIVLISKASASCSEIVAQTLQDYGRALIVGDTHSYGKGSFQFFSHKYYEQYTPNPLGEFTITKGRYYTVSGKSPQLKGVFSDIVAPGPLNQIEYGESQLDYPLPNDTIEANYEDSLSDLSFFERQYYRRWYEPTRQKVETRYQAFLSTLKKNNTLRMSHNKDYQLLIHPIENEEDHKPTTHIGDWQLNEALNIMKDFLYLKQSSRKELPNPKDTTEEINNER